LLGIVRSQLRRRIVTGNGLGFANGFLFPHEVEKQLRDYLRCEIFSHHSHGHQAGPAHRPRPAPQAAATEPRPGPGSHSGRRIAPGRGAVGMPKQGGDDLRSRAHGGVAAFGGVAWPGPVAQWTLGGVARESRLRFPDREPRCCWRRSPSCTSDRVRKSRRHALAVAFHTSDTIH